MRRQDREVSERAKIDEVIESCDCIRLGLNAEDGAYIVPLSFGYAPEEPAKFYFHSATEGRKVSMIGSGTKAGFDLEMTRAVTQAVSIPVIASGGCGSLEHFAQVFAETDCDAALAASLFHFGELTVPQVKEYLRKRKIPVR